jgi:hypothetical protein
MAAGACGEEAVHLMADRKQRERQRKKETERD